MKNLIKRFTSFLLVVVMLIGVMPLSIMATPQKHVKITGIKSQNSKQEPSYSINIEWKNPDWGTDPTHYPVGIRITEENATSGGGTSVIQEEKDNTKQNISIDRTNLTSGSIYEYKVIPYHTHISNGGVSTEAPYDPQTPEDFALFMTDIKVDAEGYGNTLEVTFDNPTYKGKNIFTGYRIYYQQGGDTVGDMSFQSSLDVDIENKDLIPSKDTQRGVTRFTYKIINENIKPASIYAVKVEPLYNGQEIRTNDTSQVMIDDQFRKIGFNSKKFVSYRTNNAYVSIPLIVTEDGRDYLKLQWGDIKGLTTVGSIEKIEILSGTNENEITNIIGTVHGPSDVTNISSWRIAKPLQTIYFKIRFKIQGVDKYIDSEIGMYDPTIVNITPNKPEIYPKNNQTSQTPTIDLYWDTFIRPPYNKTEEAGVGADGLYFDTDVLYDVWVSDSLQNLNKPGLPKILDKVPATDLTTANIDEAKNKVFHNKITKYITTNNTGNFLEKPIVENKVYYIKIIATKPTSDGLGLSSIPSYSQVYIPPTGDMSSPKSLSRPPFRVKKDENGIDIIKQTEITVEWNTKWFEMYDSATDKWYTKVAIRNGNLVFDDDVKDTDKIINFYDKDTIEEAQQVFKDAGYTQDVVIRSMDISDKNIQYEMITVPFDEINQNGGYEKYVQQLLQSESDKWQQITPVFNGEKYAQYLITGLTENTMYAILLRPYRILTDGKKDAYPTYLLATTLPKDTIIDITPTIPKLQELSKTDVSIEVEWEKMADGVVYQLAVNETIVDNPEKASIVIDSEKIEKDGTYYNKEDGSQFFKYNITSLFPDTGYYIWIRSIVSSTGKISDWSVPIYVKTKSIIKPEPPSGFGLASEKSLSVYNTANSTDYKSITDKYLVLEWNKDADDLSVEVKADKKDSTEPLLNPNLKQTYMVKFNELLANRYYYARAKTKVYVFKGDGGVVQKSYTYIVELSSNADFKDAVEVEIPTVTVKDGKVLTSESEWTTVYKYKTQFSTDENGDYDGNIIDDLYPLPTEDFEISYDPVTQTLSYRFRANQKDVYGNPDNLVDQRFITNLVNSKAYNYNIDLTSHKGYSIKNRKVEMPYTIIRALEDRKIALSITIGGTRFTLNPMFLNTTEVKNIGKLSTNATVIIDIQQTPQNLPTLAHNQLYATTPQYITMSINNNGVYTPLTYTGSDMDVSLKLKNRSLTIENNVGAYRIVNNNVWERVPSVYSSETGTHLVKTNRLGKYTTIANGVNQTNIIPSNDTTLLTNVNNQIIFTDFTNINTQDAISVVQFNNIVAGIVNGKKQIAINGSLSESDYNGLKKSGMLLTGSVVGREAGVNTLVKLYETKTKAKFEPTSTLTTTPYKDIKNANQAYQQNLIKAGDIGFFGNDTNANPKGILTINDALYMIDIILADCGY